jgi:hypothetical protein
MAVGQDEARARAILAEMQERLVSGPHSALGIPPNATPGDIRTAFLELTKVYHPARFGRLSTETQKLSNEVFLGLRAAHDAIAPARGSLRPSAAIKPRQTGAMPPIVRPPAPSSVIPAVHTTGSLPTSRPAGPAPTTQVQPPTPIALPRLTQPTPVHRTTVPIKAMPTAVKPSGSGPIKTSPTPAQGSRAMTPLKKPIDGEANVMELLHRGQWEAANAAIEHQLAKQPESPRFRSLQAYSKGRKAQLAGQRDEARVELENALQLDPDLQLAKTALGELFTRRK